MPDRQPEGGGQMKKNEVKRLKKLRLSWETLRDLKGSDALEVVRGALMSNIGYIGSECTPAPPSFRITECCPPDEYP
jgi:hypothetical protein